ncbi:MAG: hypothetical protein EPN64_18140 [Burkholderiaceae bacterium]|nr:MAG: hypothetical protein EPN64_18140 [Burkholderiaceae bacterium]
MQRNCRCVGANSIDKVHGEAKPADKLALVERFQAQGRVVAMAGDGSAKSPSSTRPLSHGAPI